jgi:hypothetical protein
MIFRDDYFSVFFSSGAAKCANCKNSRLILQNTNLTSIPATAIVMPQ